MRAQPETAGNKICRKKTTKGCGGALTWQLTTMSSSSSVFSELSSLVWFSLLVCEERSPFGVQLPRLPRNLDKFVSIRRFCRMLCGCFKTEHTQKSREKSEESHTVACVTRLPVVPTGQCCCHGREALRSHSPQFSDYWYSSQLVLAYLSLIKKNFAKGIILSNY